MNEEQLERLNRFLKLLAVMIAIGTLMLLKIILINKNLI